MFVAHFADEFLDEVFECRDSGGSAVLVDDDGHLVPARAQFAEKSVELHGLGNTKRLTQECSGRNVGTAVSGHGHGLLDVNESDDVVGVFIDDRETRESCFAGERDDVRCTVSHLDRCHAGARSHDVLSLMLGERQCFAQECCGAFFEPTVHRRVTDGRRKLLRGSS